jgi:hypothetical protein
MHLESITTKRGLLTVIAVDPVVAKVANPKKKQMP